MPIMKYISVTLSFELIISSKVFPTVLASETNELILWEKSNTMTKVLPFDEKIDCDNLKNLISIYTSLLYKSKLKSGFKFVSN